MIFKDAAEAVANATAGLVVSRLAAIPSHKAVCGPSARHKVEASGGFHRGRDSRSGGRIDGHLG